MADFNYSDILKHILKSYKNPSKWEGSNFGGIKLISNTHVGSVGQDFIQKLCEYCKLDYEFPTDVLGKQLTQSPWDIKIEGIEFELKTASEDTTGKYQFNHIRYHRKYDALICLGISPNNVSFGIWSKGEVTTGKAGNLVSMERGANASYKLTKAPADLFDISVFPEKINEFINNEKI